MMSRAVQREPNNPRFHHRLGRIALQLHDRERAMQEFKKSIEIDPTFVDSQLSLASLQVDAELIDQARISLASAEQSQHAPKAVVLNVKAKLALAERDMSAAQKCVEEALRARRDPQNLALGVQVAIARGESGDLPLGQAAAQVQLLAKELDGLGQLAMVLDLAQKHGIYFEAK